MPVPVPATLTADDAATHPWFAVIVGAGVAGASLAAALAAEGRAVLLLDKASFPRAKTCGGTLNARALAVMQRLGLTHVLESLEPSGILGVEWRQSSGVRGIVEFDPGQRGVAVSREALDGALLREAISRGAQFLPNMRVRSSELTDGKRIVHARDEANAEHIFVGDVLCACDGLGSAIAADAGLAIPTTSAESPYIGTSVVLPPDAVRGAAPEYILMAVARSGYAGVVQVERGHWNIAAAIRLDTLKKSSSPAAAARAILESVSIQLSPLAESERWSVTPPRLERRVSSPSAGRLLLLGDAAGYTEPITGEGMAWALHAVEFVRYLLRDGWSDESAAEWEDAWRRNILDRQMMVRLAGKAARSPFATRAAIAGMRVAPGIGRWISRAVLTDVPGSGGRR